MALKNIPGNGSLIRRLTESVRTETVSHAYIFEGEARGEKRKAAREFAKAVLCGSSEDGDACDDCVNCRKMDHGNYEDYIEIQADGNHIKDEAILSLQGQLAKKPCAGSRYVVVIADADTMTPRAQNRLLKTLEEPTPGTVILLLSENTENLAQTILSRCILFRFSDPEGEAGEELLQQVKDFSRLAVEGAPFYRLAAALGETAQKKDEAAAFLDCLERRYRDMALCVYDQKGALLYEPEDREELRRLGGLLTAEQLKRAIDSIEEARRDLARNINAGYALKSMILKL